jgi:hypothetical protein
MMVRAKYRITAKEEVAGGVVAGQSEKLVTIKMVPVINGSEENKEFFKYTPSGEMRIGTLNQKAAEYFELGKEYYVDFTKSE